jgi:soluble cytochrome b562
MKKGNPGEREAEETEWCKEKGEFPELPRVERLPEKPPEQPPEKSSGKPLSRKEILEYIARTGIDAYLIWKPLRERIDKIDPAKNPGITYDEQIQYLENEVIPWATEAIEKEKIVEKTIEKFKLESRRRRAEIVKEYEEIIDIIVEEILKRIQSRLGAGVLPAEEEPKKYYKSFEELYENLDDIRKSILKDALRELRKSKLE